MKKHHQYVSIILLAVIGILALSATTRLLATPLGQQASQSNAPDFFGMNTYFTGLERVFDAGQIPDDGEDGVAMLMAMGREIGVTWAREELSWANLEVNGKGKFDWYVFDDRLLEINQAGYTIIGMVSTTPRWARVADCAERTQRYEIQGWVPEQYWCPPANPQDYADALTAMVERYDGDGFNDAPGSPRVAVWQIWNEPNHWETWLGSPAEYADLLVAGYNAVKQADPTATVLVAGVYVLDGSYNDGNGHMDGLRFLDEVLQARPDAWQTFDVLPVHPYIPDFAPDAPGLYELVSQWGRLDTANAWLDARTQQYGGTRPALWISEVGWPACADANVAADWGPPDARYRIPDKYLGPGVANSFVCHSEQEQASYMVRSHAIALALGVEHLNYLQLEDKFDGEQEGRAQWGATAILYPRTNKGAIDEPPNYPPKDAYIAYGVMTNELAGAQFVGFGPLHNYSYVPNRLIEPARYDIRLQAGDTLIDIIWRNAPGYLVDFPVEPGRNVELVTLDGQRTTLSPQNGVVSFVIGEQPVYLRQTLAPTATPTNTATAMPTATPTATPTPTVTPVVSEQGWITMNREQAAIVRHEDNGKFSEIYIPAGAVTRTTTISYTALGALPRPLPDDVDATGRAFQLKIFEDGTPTSGFVWCWNMTRWAWPTCGSARCGSIIWRISGAMRQQVGQPTAAQ
jgi:hypothetical protein